LINTINIFGNTPLIYATGNRHINVNVIKKLVNCNADLTIKNKKGRTSYDIAKLYNLSQEIILLLKPSKDNIIKEDDLNYQDYY
jgi:ankyrin repeat protein